MGAQLTNRNIAQLLARGFGDSDGAIRYLHENLSERQPAASREADSLAVARLSFDEGDLERVILTLAPLYERGDRAFDEEKELQGRALFAIALARNGEAERAMRQLPHLRSLGRAAPGAGSRSARGGPAQRQPGALTTCLEVARRG